MSWMIKPASVMSLLVIGTWISAGSEGQSAQVRPTPQRAPARIAAPPASGATDVFLKIPDVEGESTDAEHGQWIDVISVSWLQGSASARRAGPTGNGPGSVTLVKRIDRSSPRLTEACAKGRSLGSVVVHTRPSARSRGALSEYVLDETKVASCRQSTTDGQPSESITLNFGKVESQTPGGGDPDRPLVNGR